MSGRRVPYRKFAQHVRRYDTRLLLQKIAAADAELHSSDVGKAPVQSNPNGPVHPFSLAAVARTALVERGLRKRRTPSKPVTNAELHELCALVIESDHPDVPESGILDSLAMTRMLARLAYQQGVFAYSPFENIARSVGLLVEHDTDVCDLPTPDGWVVALGVSLPNYMTIVFQLTCVASMTYGGRISHDNIRQCHELGLFAGTDLGTVQIVLRQHLSAPLRTHVEQARRDEVPTARMWSQNPLVARPLIEDEEGYLLPVHRYLIEKITPLGLFFTGVQAFGQQFAGELGKSFESYIGRHLALLEAAGATIHPEVTYGPENRRTIDYFVVFDEVVVLVEVKSFKATAAARAGIDTGLAALVEKVQRARDQIDNTAALIEAEIPELAYIPTGVPVRGLVVTAEPLHSIDTFLYRDMFNPNVVESSTASAHDIERICPTLVELPDAGARLLDALTFSDPTPPSLDRAVEGVPCEKNSICDALWQRWDEIAPTTIALRTR